MDKNYPQDELMEQIAVGAERYKDSVWVVRERDERAIEALESFGIEPVLAPLNPFYRVVNPENKREALCDNRRAVRDFEIRRYCSHVMVFRDLASETSKWWTQSYPWDKTVRLFEAGKRKAKKRVGRKPRGV